MIVVGSSTPSPSSSRSSTPSPNSVAEIVRGIRSAHSLYDFSYAIEAKAIGCLEYPKLAIALIKQINDSDCEDQVWKELALKYLDVSYAIKITDCGLQWETVTDIIAAKLKRADTNWEVVLKPVPPDLASALLGIYLHEGIRKGLESIVGSSQL